MPIKAKGAAATKLTEVLDDLLLSRLQNHADGRLRVVGKSDIDAILGLERTRDALGCDEVTCAVDVAGALGVDSIIAASVGTLGAKHFLTLVWIDQKRAQAFRRHTEDLGEATEDFDAGVERAVLALLGKPLRDQKQSAKPSPDHGAETVVFADDFVDNRNGWWTGETDKTRVWIADGSYYFEFKTAGNWMVWHKVDLNERDDFTIEADIARLSGPDGYGFGVDWGIRDGENHYSFLLFNTGRYMYWKRVDNKDVMLLPDAPSASIKTGATTNHIEIRRLGTRLEFRVNGTLVTQAPFEPFFGSKLGFHIWQLGTLRVDKLLVRQLRRE